MPDFLCVSEYTNLHDNKENDETDSQNGIPKSDALIVLKNAGESFYERRSAKLQTEYGLDLRNDH